MKHPFILYDDQIFNHQEYGGISRYFCEIIRNIHMKYDISVRYSKNYYLKQYSLGKHRISIPKFIFSRYEKTLLRKNTKLSKKLLQSDFNYLFHPTYYDSYFLAYIRKHPFVITVHDMIYEKFPDYLLHSETIINQKKEVIRKASRIIAISENTKKDIIEILNIKPDKIDVVYHATSMIVPEKHVLKLPPKYILFVGDRSSYKNFNRFLMAFVDLSKVDNSLSVICTGRAFETSEMETFEHYNLHNKIIHISASDKTMSELYHRAEVFVYPSLYEGFGIPILEAFASHCPVALSNTSCFPEIAGDAGAYFDPYDISSITDTLRNIIYNKSERAKLISAGKAQLKLYSWEKAARQTEEIYKRVLSESVHNTLSDY